MGWGGELLKMTACVYFAQNDSLVSHESPQQRSAVEAQTVIGNSNANNSNNNLKHCEKPTETH